MNAVFKTVKVVAPIVPVPTINSDRYKVMKKLIVVAYCRHNSPITFVFTVCPYLGVDIAGEYGNRVHYIGAPMCVRNADSSLKLMMTQMVVMIV